MKKILKCSLSLVLVLLSISCSFAGGVDNCPEIGGVYEIYGKDIVPVKGRLMDGVFSTERFRGKKSLYNAIYGASPHITDPKLVEIKVLYKDGKISILPFGDGRSISEYSKQHISCDGGRLEWDVEETSYSEGEKFIHINKFIFETDGGDLIVNARFRSYGYFLFFKIDAGEVSFVSKFNRININNNVER